MASGHKMPAVLADLEAVPGSDMCIYISVCGGESSAAGS